MNRKALGRGLSSIIPEPSVRPPASTPLPPAPVPPAPASEGVRSIDIDRIRPNREQPRQRFDEAALESLAKSLKEDGMLQPVVVRPADGDRFELVAGERRWRAAQRAGLHKVLAVVREVPDDAVLELALVENLQREDLNPMEEASAYRTLTEEVGLSQQQVAERVGKQRATIANTLRLLTLPKSVQDRVRRNELSGGQARAIASLADATEQERLAEKAVREGLSVRQLERLVSAAPKGKPRSATRRDPNVVAAEQNLQRALGTRVRIFEGPKGGRIELQFFNKEDLQRVYQVLLDAARRKA